MNRERVKQIRKLQSGQPDVKNRTIEVYDGDFNQLVDTILDRWWGNGEWRRLKGLKPHERSEIVCAKFRQELGCRNAYGWPIMSKKDRGKIMYYMVHASDHGEAHKLMARAYRFATGLIPHAEQLEFELRLNGFKEERVPSLAP